MTHLGGVRSQPGGQDAAAVLLEVKPPNLHVQDSPVQHHAQPQREPLAADPERPVHERGHDEVAEAHGEEHPAQEGGRADHVFLESGGDRGGMGGSKEAVMVDLGSIR